MENIILKSFFFTEFLRMCNATSFVEYLHHFSILVNCIYSVQASVFLTVWLQYFCDYPRTLVITKENVQRHPFSVTFVESPGLDALLPYKAYKKSLGKEASPRKCSHHSAAVCGQEKENTDKTKQHRVQEAITLASGIFCSWVCVCVWLERLVCSCVLYSDICVYIVYGV